MPVLLVLMAAIYFACQKPEADKDLPIMESLNDNQNSDSTVFCEIFKPSIERRELKEIEYTFPGELTSKKIMVEVVDGYVIYEGDIVLFKEGVADRDAGKPGDEYRWAKGTIPYVIESGHPYRNVILSAINQINQNTILRVQPRNGEANYVRFINGDGCWSEFTGKGSGENTISIGEGCGVVGIVMHEIFHAAGVFHEQNRADRNDHVRILTDNIQTGQEHNFVREPGAISFFNYDFGSIMHYPSKAFSKNGLPTIEPLYSLPPGVQMGQREALSTSDIGGIRKLYLKSTMTLNPGQYKRSPNGDFELKYQNDGNLVLRRRSDGKILWTSRTADASAGSCVMQGDGNLVIRNAGGQIIWRSGTGGDDFFFSRLAMQNDGNLVIYNRDDQPVWSTGTNGGKVAKDVLNPGESLKPDKDIWSNNRQYQLKYQNDGNLVIYRNRNHAPLWSSQTNGQAAGKCIMQVDGNLVIYTPAGQPVWQSGTNSNANKNSKLVMQDDGNLVIYNPSGQPTWASGTNE